MLTVLWIILVLAAVFCFLVAYATQERFEWMMLFVVLGAVCFWSAVCCWNKAYNGDRVQCPACNGRGYVINTPCDAGKEER